MGVSRLTGSQERALFIRVLEYMEQEGRAKLFTASDPSKLGVKILKQ